MQMMVDGSGLDALRQKLADACAALSNLLQEATLRAGDQIRQSLSDAAPVGQGGGGTPPEGDASGPLRESFYVQEEPSAFNPGAAISVRTTQPTKLYYVTRGRGEILPVNKRALFWSTLAHPVRRAGPAQANDFVTPMLAEMPGAPEVLGIVAEQLAEILEA